MLRKRLIGVIAVLEGWAVQSIGYRRYLPLGRPEILAENLDRWGVDEIMILALDRSRRGLEPDFDLVGRLAAMGLGTPLSYGGGISTSEHGVAVTRAGVERLCIDSLLHDAPDMVPELSAKVGAQALVAALPVSISGSTLSWYDHRSGISKPLAPAVLDLLKQGAISEALLVDYQHEGIPQGFSPSLIDAFTQAAPEVPVLAYGGISEAQQIRALLARRFVTATCVGNFLNYREHAVQLLKQTSIGAPLRPATFAGWKP